MNIYTHTHTHTSLHTHTLSFGRIVPLYKDLLFKGKITSAAHLLCCLRCNQACWQSRFCLKQKTLIHYLSFLSATSVHVERCQLSCVKIMITSCLYMIQNSLIKTLIADLLSRECCSPPNFFLVGIKSAI